MTSTDERFCAFIRDVDALVDLFAAVAHGKDMAVVGCALDIMRRDVSAQLDDMPGTEPTDTYEPLPQLVN